MSCDNLPPPTTADTKSAVADIANALGTKSCTNNSDVTEYSTSLSTEASAPMVSGNLDVDSDFTKTITSNTGCEQITIAANTFASANQKITCIMSSDTSNVKSTTTAINSIVFDVGGNFTGNNITITQGIIVKLMQTMELSSTVTQKISDQVKVAAMSAVDAVQNSTSGIGSTPQGSKLCIQAKTDILNQNLAKTVEDSFKNIESVQQYSNSIVFKVKGDFTVKDSLVINQDIVLDIIASQILTSSVSKTLESFSTSISEFKAKAEQVAKNLGVESIGGKAGKSAALKASVRNQGRIGMAIVIMVGIAMMFLFSSKVKPGNDPNDPAAGAQLFGFTLAAASMFVKWGGLMSVILIFIMSGAGIWWSFSGYYTQYDKRRAELLKKVQLCVSAETEKPGENPDCAKDKLGQEGADPKPPYAIMIASFVGVFIGLIGAYIVFRLFTAKPAIETQAAALLASAAAPGTGVTPTVSPSVPGATPGAASTITPTLPATTVAAAPGTVPGVAPPVVPTTPSPTVTPVPTGVTTSVVTKKKGKSKSKKSKSKRKRS